jgi:hypothetical protein
MQQVHTGRAPDFHEPNGIAGIPFYPLSATSSPPHTNNSSNSSAMNGTSMDYGSRRYADMNGMNLNMNSSSAPIPQHYKNGTHQHSNQHQQNNGIATSQSTESEFLFHGTELVLNQANGTHVGHDSQPLTPSTFDELFQHLKSSQPMHTSTDFLSSASDISSAMNPFRLDSQNHSTSNGNSSSNVTHGTLINNGQSNNSQQIQQSQPHPQFLASCGLSSAATAKRMAAGLSPPCEQLKYTPKPNEEIIGQIISKKMNEPEEYIDVAPYVTLPQHEAAKKLGIPSSTLSKKWKDATVNRKWPYRALAKIDKEIMTLMHNIPRNSDGSGPVAMDPELEEQLSGLLKKRQGEARSVIIRLS